MFFGRTIFGEVFQAGSGRAWLWVGLLLLVAGGALAALAWLALS